MRCLYSTDWDGRKEVGSCPWRGTRVHFGVCKYTDSLRKTEVEENIWHTGQRENTGASEGRPSIRLPPMLAPWPCWCVETFDKPYTGEFLWIPPYQFIEVTDRSKPNPMAWWNTKGKENIPVSLPNITVQTFHLRITSDCLLKTPGHSYALLLKNREIGIQ